MALCRVTGTLYVPSGEPAASYVLYLTRLNKSVVADYNGSVVPEVVRVPVGRDGAVDFEILTGSYYGIARPCGSSDGFAFNFAVPDAATAAFEACIDAIAPPNPPPEWLQRVEDAVSAAEAAAAAAQASADAAGVVLNSAAQTGMVTLDGVAGTANAITATLPTGVIPINGMNFIVTPTSTNTGPATVTFGGVTYAVQNGNVALSGGELLAGAPVLVRRITGSALRLVGATTGQANALAARVAAVEPILRTITNADSATNRSTATYITPNTDVTFNPNGEGGLIIKVPPSNWNSALVNARMSVRRRGDTVVQTMYLTDGKVYEKTWLGSSEGVWSDKTPYSPPARVDVNADALGGGARNFNNMLATNTTWTSTGAAIMSNAPPNTSHAYIVGKWQTFDVGPMLVQRVWLGGQPSYSSYERHYDKATSSFVTAWVRPIPIIPTGPRMVAFGDSITAGVGVGANDPDGYALRAASLLNSPITRLATAGRMMCGVTTGDFIPALDLTANAATIADAEIIWVAYGTNDWGGNVPIGTETDTDNGTFYGAMKEGLTKLRALNPTAKVCFFTPIYRGHAYSDPKDWSEAGPNPLGLLLEDYREAIRRFCAVNDIPVMEMSAYYKINNYTAPTYLPADQLHPGRLGHRVMGGTVATMYSEWGWASLAALP